MSKVVYKYDLEPKTTLTIRRGAKLLSVGRQSRPNGYAVVAWFLVETACLADERRKFVVVPTGVELPEHGNGCVYRGTAANMEGSLVFHGFEDQHEWEPIPFVGERVGGDGRHFEVCEIADDGMVWLRNMHTGYRELMSPRWIAISGWWWKAP